MQLTTSFKPRDDFSKALLLSIPNKATAWLRNLQLLKRQNGSLGPLSWRIRNNDLKSFIQINDTRIEWLGSIGDVYYVTVNEAWVDDLAMNMDKFIALEKSIYNEIQKYEDKILEDQKIEVPIALRAHAGKVISNDGILPTLQTA